MKYCPYCGADLLGGTVSFCSECGKSIKGRKTKAKSEKKPPAERKKKTKTKVPKDVIEESEPVENPEVVDDGYDGYYDDVLPVDENVERQGLDKTMVKNLIIIIAGVIVAMVIILDDIEYAGSGKPKDGTANGNSQTGNAVNANTPATSGAPGQDATPTDNNFTGFQNFGGNGGMFDEN